MRARRGIMLGGSCILGGAVVSVVVAEGIGCLGVGSFQSSYAARFVAAGGAYIGVTDESGPGWRSLRWSVLDKQSAAIYQYALDKNIQFLDGTRPDPSYLHCDPPDTLPRWAALWRTENWPRAAGMAALQQHQATELAAGWPLPAFCMDWDTSRPNEHRGGVVIADPPMGRTRALLWRPIPLNLALDTLFYAVGVAGLAGGGRLLVRARRRRRGACVACGYDRRRLAAGAVCPECGRSS